MWTNDPQETLTERFLSLSLYSDTNDHRITLNDRRITTNVYRGCVEYCNREQKCVEQRTNTREKMCSIERTQNRKSMVNGDLV